MTDYAALAPLFAVLAAIVGYFVWRYRTWVLDHLEVVAGGGALLLAGLAWLLFESWRSTPEAPRLPPEKPSRSTEAAREDAEKAEHERKVLHDEIEEAKAIPDDVERRRKLVEIGRKKTGGKPLGGAS